MDWSKTLPARRLPQDRSSDPVLLHQFGIWINPKPGLLRNGDVTVLDWI
jgi:hypothetical protein